MSEYVEPNMMLEELSGLVSDVSFMRDIGLDMNRYSQDNKTNNYDYKLIDLCKILGLFIVNGRCGRDACIGHNTCKNASLVYCCILSPRLFVRVHRFCVHEFCPLFSDVHNAISCSIKSVNHTLECEHNEQAMNSSMEKLKYKNPSGMLVKVLSIVMIYVILK